MKPKVKKFKVSEYRAMIGELYGAAEMFWADRLGGTLAVEVLKRACEMTGDEYVPRQKELEESY